MWYGASPEMKVAVPLEKSSYSAAHGDRYPVKIAIQGELGSFSHQAALLFDPRAAIAPCKRAPEAFAELEAGSCDAIALPIENTLAGSVVEHYDLLLGPPIHIERETFLHIEHALIGLPGSHESTISRAYSHPVALAQCRRFFTAHPAIEPIPFYDTAGAVKQIVELRDRHAAAIAGPLAASLYGGSILLRGIEDDPANYTRFLLVRTGEPPPCDRARDEASAGQPCKFSFAFTLEHRPGALASLLRIVADASANITKVQTRPIPGHPWRYTFYLDCLVSPRLCQDLTASLRKFCLTFQSFGCYPPAELPGAPDS